MNLKDILMPGRRYTIATFYGLTGFPHSYKITLSHVSKKSNYLSSTAKEFTYFLVSTDKGLDRIIPLVPDQQYVIWSGHHKVNTAILVSQSIMDTGSGAATVLKKWPGQDPRYMLRAKKSVKQDPIAEFIKPLTPEVLLTYQCIS